MLLSLGRGWVIGPGGNLFAYWWIFLPVTLAIVFFGIGWNLLGDGLSEALEPTAIAHGDDSFSKHKQKKMDVGAVVAVDRLHNPDTLSSLPDPSALPLTRIPIGSPPELDPLLQTARIALARQDLELALHAYSHLTKHGRQLHAVTHDLAQAAERFPRYAQIWKALGDVLAQTGNYEYAVKAYKQFRKLTQ
jgi:tetratricopeptide (TPR) repeat protein